MCGKKSHSELSLLFACLLSHSWRMFFLNVLAWVCVLGLLFLVIPPIVEATNTLLKRPLWKMNKRRNSNEKMRRWNWWKREGKDEKKIGSKCKFFVNVSVYIRGKGNVRRRIIIKLVLYLCWLLHNFFPSNQLIPSLSHNLHQNNFSVGKFFTFFHHFLFHRLPFFFYSVSSNIFFL